MMENRRGASAPPVFSWGVRKSAPVQITLCPALDNIVQVLITVGQRL